MLSQFFLPNCKSKRPCDCVYQIDHSLCRGNGPYSIDLPILNESYDINHLPGSDKVLDAPPQVRREGNITIIPVISEITVVQKKYVVIKELQLVRKITQTLLSQEITLRTEHVAVTREKEEY